MITVRELGKSKLVDHIIGDLDRYIIRASTPEEADSDSLVFVDNDKPTELIEDTKAGIVVCYCQGYFKDKTLLVTPNPRLLFKELLEKYFKWPPLLKISKSASIQKGTVIGESGFGYFPGDDDSLILFPHIKGVVIEDDVAIGSNCTIARGALTDTVIGQGTKIDNLVHIAHNVKIGKHCVFCSQVSVNGSAKIGDYTWVGPNVGIRDWVNIGKRVIVGIGAVVTKDVPDNAIVVGVPAKQIGENIPFRRIP